MLGLPSLKTVAVLGGAAFVGVYAASYLVGDSNGAGPSPFGGGTGKPPLLGTTFPRQPGQFDWGDLVFYGTVAIAIAIGGRMLRKVV